FIFSKAYLDICIKRVIAHRVTTEHSASDQPHRRPDTRFLKRPTVTPERLQPTFSSTLCVTPRGTIFALSARNRGILQDSHQRQESFWARVIAETAVASVGIALVRTYRESTLSRQATSYRLFSCRAIGTWYSKHPEDWRWQSWARG